MYVKKHIRISHQVALNWKSVVALVLMVSLITIIYLDVLHMHVAVSMSVISGISTAISFFIAFFTAQAYDRWWEARKIWGAFVNDSRSFGRMVMTLFGKAGDGSEIPEIQERLIRRHIAYLYAVKARLREEGTETYSGYVSEEDARRVEGASNVGNTLLGFQSEDIDAAERSGHIDVIRMAQLNDMLSRFSTSQGMAERIKGTVFPAHYASMIRISIWIFILVFPAALSEEIGHWAIFFSSMLGTIFLLVYRAGQALLDPFEGEPNDTPMTSIVRTIEINLLEQIGEKTLPAPVEPINGNYLM